MKTNHQPTTPSSALFIAGGYGIVGSQLCRLLRAEYPELPMVVGGRNPEKASRLAAELGGLTAVSLDLDHPEPLGDLRPQAVIAAVNDPANHLLNHAARLGIPYLDLTRWTAALKTALAAPGTAEARAPLLFASGWMAGTASIASVALARDFTKVDSIDISILYALADKSGPDSTEYMDRLATPFSVTRDGRETVVKPLRDRLDVVFSGTKAHPVYRFDTPDQFLLPTSTGAASVSARIGFDDALTTRLLAAMSRIGLWKLLNLPVFTPLRRGLLHNPGSGASHRITIRATGSGPDGTRLERVCTIHDPLGQTHLTAVSALIHVERLLGWDGAPPPAPGPVFPDSAPRIDWAWKRLRAHGVEIDCTP